MKFPQNFLLYIIQLLKDVRFKFWFFYKGDLTILLNYNIV